MFPPALLRTAVYEPVYPVPVGVNVTLPVGEAEPVELEPVTVTVTGIMEPNVAVEGTCNVTWSDSGATVSVMAVLTLEVWVVSPP